MKKISFWIETAILILAVGLTGFACSREQAKEQGKEQQRVIPPQSPAPATEKAMPSPDHGKAAEEPKKTAVKQTVRKRLVIARVNGSDITLSELIGEMNAIRPQFIKDAAQKTPENVARMKDAALGILIFRELAAQEAVRQGMKVKPEVIAESTKQLRTNLGSEDNYRKFLEKTGYTDKSLKRQIERDKLFEMIASKEIFQKAKANDQAAIEKRKNEWEKGLKKNAKIEIFLAEVDKEIREQAKKENHQ